MYYKISFSIFAIALFFSCQNQDNGDNSGTDSNPNTSKQLVFEEIDSKEGDWIWAIDTIPNESTKILKGQTWKEWRKTFKDCMQAQWIKKSYYFGPTNTVGLGSITKKNYESLERTLDGIFTPTQIATFINEGSPASCEIKRTMELDLEVALNGELQTQGSANIRLALSRARSSTTTIDGFQVDNLITGNLRDLLISPENDKIKRYRNDLLKKDNVLVAKVIRVSGFTTEIELLTEIDAALDAELADNPEIAIGKAGLKVRFSKKNNTTISVKSLGDFVVFGKFVRVKEVDL